MPRPCQLDGWFVEAVRVARHRGPDGAGYWVAANSGSRSLDDRSKLDPARVALGFSRLAILDLTPAGDQPVIIPGRATMIFNGAIYNYIELREELVDSGWSFVSSGDSEVLLKAYLQWGTDAFARLDGMWALAIYDERARSLLLSRDRFGEKPLFWTRWRDGLAFASEVKQLTRYPGVVPKLDLHRAAGFVVTGRPYDGPSSWFNGIYQLHPGGWLRVDWSGVTHGSYFNLDDDIAAVRAERSAEDWADRFRDSISRSIRRRLRSDVPVGTSLSAGIDSSMILAEATIQGHQGYRTFTASSDEPRIDESSEAARFAASQGSIWTEVRANPDEFASLWDRLTWHQECPIPSTSVYAQWKVFEAARAAGVLVILDGQGADEILGGYNRFIAAMIWRIAMSRPHQLLGPLRGFVRQVGTLDNLRSAGYRYLGTLGGSPPAKSWLRPRLFSGEPTPRLRVSGRELRQQDLLRWSLPNLLAYADRNAMAHSVETRLPYLDPTLVALALAMPDEVVFRDGWTKWPLRVALAARAGVHPAWSPGKRWFAVPQQRWLRGALMPFVRDWLTTPHRAWEDITQPEELRRFQLTWQSKKPSYAWDDQVFKMVALDRFLRTWFPA